MNNAIERSTSVLTHRVPKPACCLEPFDIQSRIETFSNRKMNNLRIHFVKMLESRLRLFTFNHTNRGKEGGQWINRENFKECVIMQICRGCHLFFESCFEQNKIKNNELKVQISLGDCHKFMNISLDQNQRVENEKRINAQMLEKLRTWEDPDIFLEVLRKDNEGKKNANLRSLAYTVYELRDTRLAIEREIIKANAFNRLLESISDDMKQKLIDDVKSYNQALSEEVDTFSQILEGSSNLPKDLIGGDKDYSLELELDMNETQKKQELVFAFIEKNGIQVISRTFISESEL